MPTVSLTRIHSFCASHRLHLKGVSAAENRRLFGKCNNKNGHGHNYRLEVTVSGEVHGRTGMVMNLSNLKRVLQKTVDARLDHKNLNMDVPVFRNLIPTAENIAIEIWRMIRVEIPEALQLEVKLFETDKNVVQYRGG